MCVLGILYYCKAAGWSMHIAITGADPGLTVGGCWSG